MNKRQEAIDILTQANVDHVLAIKLVEQWNSEDRSIINVDLIQLAQRYLTVIHRQFIAPKITNQQWEYVKDIIRA